MGNIQKRTCAKCGVEKLLSEFQKDKHCVGGHTRRCRDCDGKLRLARVNKARETAAPGTQKVCTLCKISKPLTEFHHGGARYGRQPRCIPCGARYMDDAAKKAMQVRGRKKKTGFSEDDVNTALEMQDHCCAICHIEFSKIGAKATHADHDHLTGEKRGVLCSHCNHGLGKFNDSALMLRRAAEYLENPPLRGVL